MASPLLACGSPLSPMERRLDLAIVGVGICCWENPSSAFRPSQSQLRGSCQMVPRCLLTPQALTSWLCHHFSRMDWPPVPVILKMFTSRRQSAARQHRGHTDHGEEGAGVAEGGESGLCGYSSAGKHGSSRPHGSLLTACPQPQLQGVPLLIARPASCTGGPGEQLNPLLVGAGPRLAGS